MCYQLYNLAIIPRKSTKRNSRWKILFHDNDHSLHNHYEHHQHEYLQKGIHKLNKLYAGELCETKSQTDAIKIFATNACHKHGGTDITWLHVCQISTSTCNMSRHV